MKISTVFFDLGNTLVYAKDLWSPIYAQADRAMVAVLQHGGIPLDERAFTSEHGGFIESYYQKQFEGDIEPTSIAVLREILRQKGFPGIPEALLREAMDGLYTITGKNWLREEDAIETLDTLKSQGYRLGIISNTSDDNNVQEIVDRQGLRPYFEYIVTSAALGIRKPDGRIFKAALDHFQVLPASVVMVGDLLPTDILGANRMGIYSIWITRHAHHPEEGELAIQPQAVVSTLRNIPVLLDEVNADRGPGLA